MGRRFEFVDGRSEKFWEVARRGAKVTVRFGRLGAAGQSKTKDHGDVKTATREFDKLVAAKIKKGYVEIGASRKSTPKSPPEKTRDRTASSGAGIRAALQRWLTALEADDVVLFPPLRPPYDGEPSAAFEAATGLRLPAEIDTLYRLHDGQPRGLPKATDIPQGHRYAGLFGHYRMLPVDEAIARWTRLKKVDGDPKGFPLRGESTVREGDEDKVLPDEWNPRWLPIGTDDTGNDYFADMAPLKKGAVGQVLVSGADESERVVMASSLEELLLVGAWMVERALLGDHAAPRTAPANAEISMDRIVTPARVRSAKKTATKKTATKKTRAR